MAGFVGVRGVLKKAHRRDVEGRKKGYRLNWKMGLMGGMGRMGIILLPWYGNTQNKKKWRYNNKNNNSYWKEKWRYLEWQKERVPDGDTLCCWWCGAVTGCYRMEATCTRVSILHFRELLITLVAQLGIALGGDEEFFGLLGGTPYGELNTAELNLIQWRRSSSASCSLHLIYSSVFAAFGSSAPRP